MYRQFITYVHIKFHIPGFTQLNIKTLSVYLSYLPGMQIVSF
jgi:hypothetical protein